MKTRIYLKVAKLPNGKQKVSVGTKPNFTAISNGNKWSIKSYPTVQIAFDLDIPDKEFDASRILLEAKIAETKPCVEIKQVKEQ